MKALQKHEILSDWDKALRQGTLSHAYLFSGFQGEDAVTFLEELVGKILREDTMIDQSFEIKKHKIKERIHPDIQWLGEDPSEQSIKIKAVRDLQSWLLLKPVESSGKIVVILDCERLTTEAQNAFLKTLEEPPAGCHLLLASNSPLVLLPTVLSRLTHLTVKVNSVNEITRHLSGEYGLTDDAPFFAYLAGGSTAKAKEYIENEAAEIRREMLDAFFNLSFPAYLKQLEGTEREKLLEHLSFLLDIFRVLFRDILLLQRGVPKTSPSLANRDYAGSLADLSQAVSSRNVQDALERASELKKYLEGNVNVKMVLSSLEILVSELSERNRLQPL